MADNDGIDGGKPSAAETPIGALWAGWFGVVLLILALAGFFFVANQSAVRTGSVAVSLFGGLALLVVSLAGLIIIFRALGMGDENAALGMPPGSVRALLALSLIVVFVVIVAWVLALPANHPNQDIAKQVLTVVATVLVTVVGFYFGSNSATDAARTANATIKSVQQALAGPGQDGAGAAAPAASAPELAKTASAIAALATAAQSRLTAASQHLGPLREAVTKAGQAGQPLQAGLAAAETAFATMQAKAQALATDADRAKSAAADLAGAAPPADKLNDIAQRLGQLNADATGANHDFEQAAAAFDAAREGILKQTAQG